MAVTISILNAGNMTLGSGGSSGHSETRVTYANNTTWSGEIEEELTWESIPYIEEVETVDIGTSVTSILRSFEGCMNLTSVTIPDSVTSIVKEAFMSCNSLKNVTIGSGIQGIGESAFATNGSPITLTIGKTVAEVQAMG